MIRAVLEIKGVDLNLVDRLHGDTPLHKAVRYINTVVETKDGEDPEAGLLWLLHDGADPR